MVAKIESGKSIKGILYYNENKVDSSQAHLILASGFATDVSHMNLFQKLERFEYLTELNDATKTNAIHISLNFDDKDVLSNQKLQQIAVEYMEGIGFGDQPFLVYRHFDAAHPHIHIVTTNIKSDGKRIDIHNLGKTSSEDVRKALESKYDLVRAEGQHKSDSLHIMPLENLGYGKAPTKASINGVVHAVIKDYKFTSLAEFNMVLKQFNVVALRGNEKSEMYRKNGLMYSIIDSKGEPIGVPIKASRLYGKPTLKTLGEKFLSNKEQRKFYKTMLTADINSVFDQYHSITKVTFTEEMAKKKVRSIFYQSAQEQVYGLSFIDNARKTVFSGSALGKDYTAKAITDRFSDHDMPLTSLVTAYPRVPQKTENVPVRATGKKFIGHLQRSLAADHNKRAFERGKYDLNPYRRRKRSNISIEQSQEPEQSI